ncbi:MAG TPA: hypothetical protein VK618_07440 [Flavitalea sp.]|nr:hypothetical protein [Flavitalea sp.]
MRQRYKVRERERGRGRGEEEGIAKMALLDSYSLPLSSPADLSAAPLA